MTKSCEYAQANRPVCRTDIMAATSRAIMNFLLPILWRKTSMPKAMPRMPPTVDLVGLVVRGRGIASS